MISEICDFTDLRDQIMVEFLKGTESFVKRRERNGSVKGDELIPPKLLGKKGKHRRWKLRKICSRRLYLLLASLISPAVISNLLTSILRLVQTKPLPVPDKIHACKYHGNCPVGSTCEVVTGGKACRPYLGRKMRNDRVSDDEAKSKRFQTCVRECLLELKGDEWYYHQKREPYPVAAYSALNGHGCVVEYQRLPSQTTNWTIPIEEWIRKRNHRVVRVDPYIPSKGETTNVPLWRALCDDPCQTQNDCRNGFICTSRDVQETTCQAATTTADDGNHDMVVVTGASPSYFRSLENLAASLTYWGPQYPLVVYNLGMNEEQLNEVRSWSNLLDLKWPNGVPTSYPEHVRSNLKNYAWKPIVINETVHKYRSILWLDAGSTFVGPVEPIEYIIRKHGIFLVQGQDNDMKWMSHPGTYEWLGYNKTTFEGGPHYAGNTQGHLFPSRYVNTVVIPNALCALNESCISPEGSHLKEHRYDQTSLSVLAHQKHVQAPHHTEYVAGNRLQLATNLSNSNRYVVWTARKTCAYYSFHGYQHMKLQRTWIGGSNSSTRR